MRKTLKKSQIKNIVNTGPVLGKTVNIILKKKQFLSQPRGAQRDVTSKCNVVSWLGSWNSKRH